VRRPPFALPVVALLALGLAACGGTGGRTGSATQTASSAAAAAPPPATNATLGVAQGRLEPDYDGDDSTVLGNGQEATAADTRAIAALVERYYAAGARGDGAGACALTSPSFAATIPEDYGQELGPAIPPGAETYLRGARTCTAVLSLLFEHLRGQLAAAVEVTAVRLKGDYGYAIVGSATLPASLIEVGREGGAWRIDGLLGRPLP
jgi:ketosteroid isomerase-like protein